MANKLPVVWTNGLNVHPIHFEQQSRSFERQLNAKSILIKSNQYGIIQLSFSSELLSQGKIGLSYVFGISVDGTVFEAPNQDILPPIIELNPQIKVGSIIVLRIPITEDTKTKISLQNNIENTKFIATNAVIASETYEGVEMPTLEETDMPQAGFSQEKISIILASVRLSLGIFGTETSHYTQIPIARIKNIATDNSILLDDKFIPTSFNIATHPFVKSYLEEMKSATQGHKNRLEEMMNIQSRDVGDFASFTLLGLLNRWYAIFTYLSNKSIIHPEYLYEKLLEFIADFSIFNTDKRNKKEYLSYNHLDLSAVLFPLFEQSKILFSIANAPKYISANFTSHNNGFYDCIFDNTNIIQESDIYFAVSSDLSLEKTMNNFKNQSKVYSQDKIRHIVSSQLRGINIEQIAIVPQAIPHLEGYVYYKIDKDDQAFRVLKGSSIISFYVTNIFPNLDIKMWAIVRK